MPNSPRVSCYARRRLRGHPAPLVQICNCARSLPCMLDRRHKLNTGKPSVARRAPALGEIDTVRRFAPRQLRNQWEGG